MAADIQTKKVGGYSNTGYFILSCNHVITYKIWPEILSEVYCIKCNAGVVVVGYQYVSRCSDCPWTCATGTDRSQNIRKASQHYFRCPDHTINLFDTTGTQYKMIGPSDAPQLPGTTTAKRARIPRERAAS